MPSVSEFAGYVEISSPWLSAVQDIPQKTVILRRSESNPAFVRIIGPQKVIRKKPVKYEARSLKKYSQQNRIFEQSAI